MHTPPALLRFIARAALNIAGGGVLGDFAVDVLPDMAKDVWKWWNRGRPEDQLRAELQAVARLSVAETKGYAKLAAQVEGAGHLETVCQAVADYVALVPNAIRQSQRCRGDSSGRSLSSELSLQRAEDLLLLLPSKMPRFRPGDRPPGIGDWELQELLGVGGFGEVWMACNPHLPHTVAALKFCTDATAAKVLRNEAALLGRVMCEGKHLGIVKLLHTYLNAETPCLEYEYVAGGDLTKVIAQWHRSPSACTVEKATKLVYRLAEIVAYAHKLNPPIVHRDLKPANILLNRTDKGGYAPRVADFGIGGVVAGQALAAAKRSRVGCNLLPTVLRGAHTPFYASPQQKDGEPPDPRDDVHALGVIWYQLLTGDMNSVSLPADWQDEVRSRGVSEDFLALLASCLASRAEKRPTDAAELARRISEIQAAPGLQVDQAIPSGLALPDLMRNEWHYTIHGQPAASPISATQLKQLAASGQLKPTDLVWQEGMVEWVPAGAIKGLFPPAGKTLGDSAVVPPWHYLATPYRSPSGKSLGDSAVLPPVSAKAANEWHYTLNGQQAIAPITATQLKQLAASGQLKPTDFVWQYGMLEWVPANSVKGLFPAAAPSPAPAVLPAPAAPIPSVVESLKQEAQSIIRKYSIGTIPSWVESLKQVEDVRGSYTAPQAIVQSGGDEESRRRDASLRPRWLREIIGQQAIVQRLSIVLNACKKLKEPLSHILFDGPPGMGKTTFANALANELGTSIQMTSGSALTKPADLLTFLTNVEEGSVLFIDEIHRMPRLVEELIYPAMKDFRFDIVLGEGMNARTINLRLKPFTLIGATTRSGMMSGPLRDRFKMHEHLEYYTVEELAEIVRINACKLQTSITDDAALELARRSRGTPRLANARLWWARSFAASEDDGRITFDIARAALDMAEVDRDGLDKQDRRYLEILVGVHGGGPVGVESLAASMSLPVDTLSDEIEPYLLREQFIVRTRRGRMATARAYQVLGRPMKPAPESQKLTDEEKAEALSPPEKSVKDRPADLFGNAIPTDLFGNEIGSKKGRKKG